MKREILDEDALPVRWIVRGLIAGVVVAVIAIGVSRVPRALTTGTFRTTDLLVDNTTAIKGNVGLCTDGTTSCTNIPHLTWNPTQVAAAAIGRMEILGTASVNTQLTGSTTAGTTLDLDIFIQGTANTTSGAATFVGGEFDALVSRSAGGNTVSNVALTLDAANGQSNIALKSLAGDWQMANGDFAVLSGNTALQGTLGVTGLASFTSAGAAINVTTGSASFHDAVNLGDAANDAIAVNGSVTTDLVMTSSAADMILRLTNNAAGGHNVAWDNGATAGFFGNKFTLYDNTSSRIDWQVDNATGNFSVPAGAFTDNNNVMVSGTATKVFTHGNVTGQELINGPTLQSFAIPNTAYGFGEVNRMEISGVVPAFPADLFVLVIRDSATADTTTHTQHSGAIAAEVTSTRSAGANDLTNTAIECTATGGQTNECLHVLAGDLVVDGGGNIIQNSGYAFLAGSFVAAGGTFFAEGNGTNAIDISGTPTNSIKTRQASALFDIENAAASTLTFYNASQGTTWVRFGNDSTPTGGPIISGAPPASANHGTLNAKASDHSFSVTSIGANTSVVVTYSHAFPNGSNCTVSPLNAAVVTEQIYPAAVAGSVTFSCFAVSSGLASNCDDFAAICVGN